MTKNFIKAIVVALSISLLAPMASKVQAEETTNSAPQIIGATSITMDMDSGEVIYAKNAESKHALASTTKLLTSLIFAENKKKTDVIPYTETSVALKETTLNVNFMGDSIKPGDSMSADEVMKAVMIYSANDTAVMMAESVAGSVDAFVEMMNAKAAELGAKNTHFTNPHGLELDANNYNYTTAYDLALIAKAAYQNEWVRETMATKEADLMLNGLKISIEQKNKILGVSGNVGGKTGTETLAGHCFVGFFQKDSKNIVTVVLGSEYGADGTNVFNDTKEIANYSYTAEKTPFKKVGDEVETLELPYKVFRFFGPEKTISAPVILDSDILCYNNDFNKQYASINYTGDKSSAWKLTGNKQVSLDFTIADYKEEVKGTILLSSMDILKANIPIYLAFVLVLIIILILIIVIIRLLMNKKSRRGRYYR